MAANRPARTAARHSRWRCGGWIGRSAIGRWAARDFRRGIARRGAAAGAGDNCTAQFRRMEQRLRQLGATYYLLETWGTTGDRYRFLCKMALAGSADYDRNRIFQATAADPLRAMQNVLEQVEQWRSGRQP